MDPARQLHRLCGSGGLAAGPTVQGDDDGVPGSSAGCWRLGREGAVWESDRRDVRRGTFAPDAAGAVHQHPFTLQRRSIGLAPPAIAVQPHEEGGGSRAGGSMS